MSNIFKEIKTEDRIFNYKYLVEGEWQQSRNRRKIEIFSPIDGSFLGRLQSVLPKEADIAVAGASLAQGAWAATPFTKKVLILKRTIELIQKNKDLLADLLTQEIGKPRQDSKAEIQRAIEIIKETIALAPEKESNIRIGKEVCLINKVPVGVILCITPFNYPIYTTATKIVPALISGNSVILKPSVLGTISVLHFAQLFNKAGIPAGVLNVVTGKGNEIGRYLASHTLVNMISFTGSSRVGKEMAKRAGMVNLVLELGGKDPAIVLADADLDKAASEIAKGAFAFAGQRCMAIKRVLVIKKVKGKLIKKLKEITQKEFSIVGNPKDEKTQMGPVISDKQADYLEKLLKDALKKGAKVVLGGRRFDFCPIKPKITKKVLAIPSKIWQLCQRKGKGRYWEATILDNVKTNMKIAWEEQFGPILPIIEVNDEKEAINVANASEYGLDAAIFTRDIKKAREIAEKLEVGQVFINTRPHRAPDQLPFTGVKSSGLGTQGIKYSIGEMTRLKAIRR